MEKPISASKTVDKGKLLTSKLLPSSYRELSQSLFCVNSQKLEWETLSPHVTVSKFISDRMARPTHCMVDSYQTAIFIVFSISKSYIDIIGKASDAYYWRVPDHKILLVGSMSDLSLFIWLTISGL